MQKIEIVFLLYPLLLLIICMVKKEKSYLVFPILLSYIVLFFFAKVGADFPAYERIYYLVKIGTPFDVIHGEVTFLWLMKVSSYFGLSYMAFRIIFLSVFLIIISYAIFKLSPNFELSFLLLMLGFLAYTISAYRQFAAMACILMSLYCYSKKNKYFSSIIWGVVAGLMHKASYLFLAYIIVMCFTKKYNTVRDLKEDIIFNNLKKYGLFYILLAIGLRFIIYFAATANILGFDSLLNSLIGFYAEYNLIGIGLIARIVSLVIIYTVAIKTYDNKLIRAMFIFYFINILVAIMLPMEVFVGRLTNNGRVLEILLIPLLANEIKKKKESGDIMVNYLPSKLTFESIMLAMYGAMYVYQLLMQSGYTPFENILFY